MGLLGEDDPAPEPGSRQRRRACAKPAANDSDIGAEYLHVISPANLSLGD
jgi:hypothetical protein